MRKLLLAAAAAVTLAAPAQAADMPVKAPPVVAAAVYSWTGFYIGGHVGYAWGRSTTVANPPDALDCGNNVCPFESVSHKVRGAFGGGHAGYNWQSNALVVGIELEGGYLGVRGSGFSPITPDHFFSTRYGAYGALTGRFGVAYDRTLFYGKAGGVLVRIRNEAIDDFPGNDPDHYGLSRRARWGFAAGGGVEHAFAGNWTARVEYLYMGFRDVRVFDLGDGLGAVSPPSPYDFRDHLHTVRFGLSYKFGGPLVARY